MTIYQVVSDTGVTAVIETRPTQTFIVEGGLRGPAGTPGATGATGPAGVGMPTGGTAGQVLQKVSGDDFDFEFSDFPPALVTNTYVVDSEAEMLALDADQGDVAVRTDLNSNFILRGTDPSDLGDWQELLGGVGNVASVNGHTGIVVLDKDDIGLGNVDNTSDANKPVSTAQATALAGKQPIDSDLTAIAAISPSNDDIIQRKAGAWTNRTPSQFKTDLALDADDVGLGNVPDVDATDRANHTGTQVAATISDFDTQVRTSQLDEMAAPTAPVDMDGQRVVNLATPIADQDAVTKAYVDAISMGLYIKAPVRVATTANINLNSPGAAIDGVTLAADDRVLVKNQTDPEDNGIWVFNGAASAMTRATDANASAEVKGGMYTFVTEGTTQHDTSWVLTTDNPIILGTTELTFSNFGSSTVPDATALLKGKVKLAGDLGGTADLPLVKRTERFLIAPFGDSRPADYVCANADDNDVEINAAIVAANALPGGADVELLDGEFIISDSIMRLPNVHIYGQGIKHTKVSIVEDGNFGMFEMDKVTYDDSNPLDNAYLCDMEINADPMLRSAEKKCVNGGNFSNSLLRQLYCHGSTATGIGDDDFYGTQIDRCLVVNCGYENAHEIVAASWAANVFTYETDDAHGYSAWAAATATLTAAGTPSDGDTVTIDSVVYTFKTVLTPTAFEVLIGGSAAAALTNLKAAVNLTGTIGTDYATGTTKHPSVTAGALGASTLVFTYNTIGTGGNAIATTETGADLSFGGATMSGGTTGSKIIITGMVPALYNGSFNVTSVPDSTHFTIASSTNSTGLNFSLDPGTATTFGITSDSLIGHNGIGIASGALDAELCVVTDCVCIGNQNNNFLIEADANNTTGEEFYVFSNCISIRAGTAGYRNTGTRNSQFNNCFDYGSPIGVIMAAVSSSRNINAASWAAGEITFGTTAAYLFTVGKTVTIAGMVPDAYNGYYTVTATPTGTTFKVAKASDPGTAIRFGTAAYNVHPVEGSSVNNSILGFNLDFGIKLPDDGVAINSTIVHDCYNYGIQMSSTSNSLLQEIKVHDNGRQGVVVIMGSGVYQPMDHVKITGHVYNNGKRFANTDGIDIDPGGSAAIQNVTLDVHAFDNQPIKTQRYGIIIRSGGTVDNIHVRGNLSGNATGPILVQNTSDTIHISDTIGVNPPGKKNLGNVSGSTSFDNTLAKTFIATLTGNITAVMPTPSMGGMEMIWILVQDGTGGRTLTLPANATAGVTLTLSTDASAIDVLRWVYDSVGGKWRLASKQLGNTDVGTLRKLVVTTPNAFNAVAAVITQNDTTNNPDAFDLTNAGTSHALLLTQSGVLASNKYGLFITSNAVQVNAALVRIRQQNASSTQAALQLDNAGSGAALDIASGNLNIAGGGNIVLSATTGTKLGTATTQKLGFFNATPIVQPGATTDLGTVLSDLGLRAAGTAYPITTSGLVTLTGGVTISAGTLALAGATITNTGTLTLPTATDTLVGRATTDTLTNKRVTPRVGTVASSATPTINTDNVDMFTITALAANITSFTTNLSGTPTTGQRLLIRIKDNGTARTIAWGASFGSSGVASLPATTVLGRTHHVLLVWDEVAALWICLASDTVGY